MERKASAEARNQGVVEDADAFDAFCRSLPGPAARIVEAADQAIRAEDPDVTQVLWAHQRTLGYGVGPKKMSEHYAYLDVYDRHVNLGFNHGASLPDPGGLLGGSGARFRSMKLSRPEDVDRPEIRELLRAAARERRETLGRP